MGWWAWCQAHPIWAPTIVGAVLRVAAAWTGFGPFAADDYVFMIEHPWRWVEEPDAPFPSAIRSPLLPRWMAALMSAADGVGITDPAVRLQAVYTLLGLASLAVIPGVYFLGRRRLGANVAHGAAWLVAVYFLMPRVATRALLGVAAMVPVVWGLVAADRVDQGAALRRFAWGLVGGSLLGLAGVIRFQAGLLGVAAFAVALAWTLRQRSVAAGAGWAGLALGGAVMVGVQGALDMHLGRPFMGTVLAYWAFNVEHASRYGVSAWYTYLLQLVVLTIPPVVFFVARPMLKAGGRHPMVGWGLVAFIGIHSLIGHKEDRFLFPILPLFLLLLAAGLVAAWARGGWHRRAVWFFGVVNTVALPIAVSSDGARSHTVPNLEIARHYRGDELRIAAVGYALFHRYYLGRSADIRRFKTTPELKAAMMGTAWRPHYVFFRKPKHIDRGALQALGWDCAAPKVYAGDWVDRVIIAINPDNNRRRRPAYRLDCARPRPARSTVR